MNSNNKAEKSEKATSTKRTHDKSDKVGIILDLDLSFLNELGLLEGVDTCFNPCNFSDEGHGNGGPSGDGEHRGSAGRKPPNGSTLSDVGGLDEQVNFLKRSVLFPLANKSQLKKWGFSPPKGIMFHGAPGCGKTLLAKALANELSRKMNTKVTFIYRKGGDCFSKFFGGSSENLRMVFQEAEMLKPSLIFFDEIDGLCPSRQNTQNSCEAYTSVVTTLLGLMDGIKRGEIFVIGATNRLNSVDPALRRPGRFDKEIEFLPPDEKGRKAIIRIHTKAWKDCNKPTNDLLAFIAAATPGFPGAHLEGLCTETINCAIERFKKVNNIETLEGIHGSQFTVEKEDWVHALRRVESPKTMAFGSGLYTPKKVECVSPLISRMVESIKFKMLRSSPLNSNEPTVKSFLIWGDGRSSDNTIDSYIIPELLSDRQFQKIPIYELSLDTLEKKKDWFIAAGNTINKVATSTIPCILYLPRCELLCNVNGETENSTDFSSFISKKLNFTQGRHVLILATSNRTMGLPKDWISMFPLECSYKIQMPNRKERKDFLEGVLNEQLYDLQSCPDTQLMKFVQDALDRCVEMTESESHRNLMELHCALADVCRRFRTENTLIDALTNVLNLYATTKLQVIE